MDEIKRVLIELEKSEEPFYKAINILKEALAKFENSRSHTATECLPPLFKGGKQEGTDAQFAARVASERSDLLPCPICGEQVRFVDYTPEWGVEFFEIECTNLICTTSLKSKNAENLINAWNKMAR